MIQHAMFIKITYIYIEDILLKKFALATSEQSIILIIGKKCGLVRTISA